ncbi:MAG: sugar phosphate isomerase/epimerase [Verrucomicrobiae bacterium]|nr:sugar phosphate isomerase/epimerase [Verrucomicrobiae bacterium]
MNRRNLLKKSSLGLLAVGASPLPLVAPTASAAGEFSGIIRKAIKFRDVNEPDLSIGDRFKLVKDLGFDGTELRTEDKDNGAEFRKAIEKSGLPVHGIVNSSNPDLTGAVEFAASVGGSSVLYVARYDRTRPLMESWNETQDIIRQGLPAAEKHQVKILVENVWAGFLISALDTVRYVDEINHPWFGSYFDVGNNVRWGVPQHWIELLGPRIGRLDIKEWDERKHRSEGLAKGFSSPIGEGTIEWDQVRAALKKINYQGWATAEVGSGDRARLADIAARMDKVLGLA